MKTVEIYTYDRDELEKSRFVNIDVKDDIKYIKENSIGNLYLANTTNNIGFISFINNVVVKPDVIFNTSIGTLITPNGNLVFNFNYVIKDTLFSSSAPEANELLVAKPTFVGGKYTEFNNIKISVQIIKRLGLRVLTIEYDK
jgi:hypothetical protein